MDIHCGSDVTDCGDRGDWPWVFDKQPTYEVHGRVTDTAEMLGIKRVAQSGDVRQSRQLVGAEERRTSTQTVIDTYRYTYTDTQTNTQTNKHTQPTAWANGTAVHYVATTTQANGHLSSYWI